MPNVTIAADFTDREIDVTFGILRSRVAEEIEPPASVLAPALSLTIKKGTAEAVP